MQFIGVFLSSHDNVPTSYRQATEEVGRWIGQSGRTLIYGGSGIGMMEVLAQSAKQAGAKIFGIVPQFVVDRNVVSDTLDVEIRTAGLADRKTILIERSDLMIALPGGVGTLEELLEVITWKQLGLFLKPIVVLNTEGYFDPLLSQLERCIDQQFMRRVHSDIWKVAATPEEAVKLCEETPLWDASIRRFAAL